MCPWVTIGSLITHFTALYGPNFFVYLNTAFYAPGLPISSLQNRLDEAYDARWGHECTFFFRMTFSLSIIAIICVFYPTVTDQLTLFILTTVLGAVTWTAHGSFVPMVSMFPRKAVGFAQFGFQVRLAPTAPRIHAPLLLTPP